MPHFNEHALGMAIMELFEQQGYSYVNGETVVRGIGWPIQLTNHRNCPNVVLFMKFAHFAQNS